jgi:hypothetical protein
MSGTSTTAWRPATTESPAKTLATARIPTTQIQRMRELKTTFELALQRHCTKNSKQIFPELKLPSLVPNFYVHESVSDLYIIKIFLPILLQQNKWTYFGNI